MIGTKLIHYEIVRHLGSGGMGDVYEAVDSKLGRRVALKFLPEGFSHDSDRLTRFQREARALASLNHSNIAAIYGLEESQGRKFLVMELVHGDTIAQRIARGAIPVDEAVAIARQIAEAIEAAHDSGIVHRDLKPANVKIKPDGQVKVLDFGLAKREWSGEKDPKGEDPRDLPTASVTASQAGVILGSVRYMAPEQAKGQTVDRRADIFAFGCVLYEMLSGQPAFDGDSTPEILSRVLLHDPDWTCIPGDLPPQLLRLIRLCLEKDPRKRRQSAGDLRIDLDDASKAPPLAPRNILPGVRRRRSVLVRLAWAVSALALMAFAAFIASRVRESVPPEMRLQVVTPPTLDPLQFALAPNGKSIVFVASESLNGAPQQLFLRALDNTEAVPIAGTRGARLPFWSPDSRSIGFFASGKLSRIDISGGPPQELAAALNPQGGTWGSNDTILFSPNTVSPLINIPAKGGTPVAATKVDARQTGHRIPAFLPDGRRFLFGVVGDPEVSGVYLGSLDSGAPKRLMASSSAVDYLAPDLLVYVQDGAVVARRIDWDSGEWKGDPQTIAQGVRGSQTAFSVSAAGIMAHRTGNGAVARLTWFDRKGTVLGRGGDLNAPDLSPDDRYIAHDRTVKGNRDVWIIDTARNSQTPFTRHTAVDGFPVWSPDGLRIAFHSQRNGTFDIWIKSANEASEEELLFSSPDNEWPLDWSRDGRYVLFVQTDQNYTSTNLWALPMAVKNAMPIPVANTSFEEPMGEFSPDANWVVYETNEFGRPEIVARAFPTPGGVVHISTNGGSAPRWSAEGKEIYFVAPDGKMMAASVTTSGSTLNAGIPQPLFSMHMSPQPFRFPVSRGGRFLVPNRFMDESLLSPITLILNWRYPEE